jgi:hypothetical protein
MTQMIALLIAAITQPCQRRFPIRIVDPIVNTHEM